MGGVPVLLLFAAIGVTYGWQPDGGGGVEYIIQVPADQIDRLQESGEVSSVIDPQVQGHVSRVVIRVGNQRLPRETPSAISQLRHEVPVSANGTKSAIVETQTRRDRNQNAFDASDEQPIPIPQMTVNSAVQPIPGLLGAQNKLAGIPASGPAEAMMKPDASPSAAGPGLSFPSSALPQSLQEAAGNTAANVRDGLNDAAQDLGNRTRGELDAAMNRAAQSAEDAATGMVNRAGNALRNGFDFTAASGSSGNNKPADAVGSPDANRFDVPSFTGTDPSGSSSANRSLASGPSTDPTDSREMVRGRDKDWQDLNQMNLRSQSNMSGGPSTDPVSNPSTDPRSITENRSTNTPSSGLGTSPTFGRLPDALNTTRRTSDDTAAQQRAAQERAAQERIAQERLAQERALQEQQAAYQRQQFEREQAARDQAAREQAARAQANANSPIHNQTSSPYPYGQSTPLPSAGQSSNFANTGASAPNSRTYGQSFPNDDTAASAITNATTDPRLSSTDAAKFPPVDGAMMPMGVRSTATAMYWIAMAASFQHNTPTQHASPTNPQATQRPLRGFRTATSRMPTPRVPILRHATQRTRVVRVQAKRTRPRIVAPAMTFVLPRTSTVAIAMRTLVKPHWQPNVPRIHATPRRLKRSQLNRCLTACC
ncbi:mu-protocadherin [Rhodopirellula maiorica SM1]|uniref:Mu-protocadherin n=1 Tax=Rhodopirellula maiorica SM1 TaxID=1265738 RepID=M5RTJ6_9BACT|nr:mu-protocadherin [Rhodopirellula maiorica]EMI18707.1 mu-protocadherin [Rhodopirellula maiorica SM1]